MLPEVSLNKTLLRADLWRVLAIAFSAPSNQSIENLRALCEDLSARLTSVDQAFKDGIAELGKSIDELDPTKLEHEHNALFSMDVLVPAYEGSYQRIERGAVVGEVAGYFRAFGLEPIDHSGPPDSMWNELAFLSWLSLKEAYAVEHQLEEELSITRNAMSEFLQDHLGRWTGAFSSRLLSTTGNPFYNTAAHLLLATVSLVADDLGITQIKSLETGELSEEPDAVACPMGGTCS